MTNRDLYRFVTGLSKRHRSLEEYLRALRDLGHAHRDADALAVADVADMLAAAFDAPVPAYDPAWEQVDRDGGEGFAGWDRRIRAQIVDLHQMAEAGALDNEYRYFGITAPSGSPWYNFDPNTFLECGVCGAFGGWEEGDESGRIYVPGEVAVFHADGTVTGEDPRSLPDPVVALPALSWDGFVDLLWAGQTYE